MKKMLWLLLAATPMQAVANEEDPIAYKCYYCTPDEMEDVALAQGVGRHYVYDAQKLTIVGYDVAELDGLLKAESFAAESWLQNQFLGMMSLYDPLDGDMEAMINDVALLAPNTEHGRSSRYIWPQDLTALNPHHKDARERVRRYLADLKELSFLDTSVSGGKLLKFKYAEHGDRPIAAWMSFRHRRAGNAIYRFDHDTRSWNYHESYLPEKERLKPVQESRDDFAPTEGGRAFEYLSYESDLIRAFMDRASWAGVPVHGQLPSSGGVRFNCERAVNDIHCMIND